MMRVALVLGCVLLGCGDNATGLDPLAPASGMRLRVRWYAYEDGARQRQVADTGQILHDATRDETCVTRRWSDGGTYCTPIAIEAVYTDASCTRPLGITTAAAAEPAYAATPYVLESEIVPSRLYRLGGRAAAPVEYYEQRGAACRGPMIAAGFAFWELGEEVPRAELVRVRASLPIGDGRLAMTFHTSDDGLRVPYRLHDRELDDECVPSAGAADLTARCVPRDALPVSHYRDAQCTEPAIVVAGTRPAPAAGTRLDPATGCTSYARLGAPVAHAFHRIGEACVELPLDDSRAFAIGEAFELPAFPREHEARADHRLLRTLIVDDRARFEQPARLFDTATGLDCSPAPVADQLRCLPAVPRAVRAAYFSDDDCLAPIDLVFQESRPCTPSPAIVVLEVGDTVEVRELAGPYPGTIYEISTGDTCLPFVPPEVVTPYVLGPELPGPFPAATFVIE